MKKLGLLLLVLFLFIGCKNKGHVGGFPIPDDPPETDILFESVYYGVYSWVSGNYSTPPVLKKSDILQGTVITGDKRTLDLQFEGIGWIWLASRWGQVTAVYDLCTGSPLQVTVDSYTISTVVSGGVTYKICIFNLVGDYTEPNQATVRFSFD